MKNKYILLSTLIMVGCTQNAMSTNPNDNNDKNSSSIMVPSTSVSSTLGSSSSSEEIEFVGGSSNSNQGGSNNNSSVVIDNSKNIIEMEKVLSLQCSQGTMYGQQYCTGDNGGYYGSWYCDWEGWWCEYTQVGDFGIDVKSPSGCTYSGLDAWYVQLNIPSDKWDGEKDYVFSFDVKSKVDTKGDNCPVKRPAISIDFNHKDASNIYQIGTFNAVNDNYNHYEYRFSTYNGSIVSNENYISISLGGRGHIEYEFRNLYLAVVE